MGTSTILLVDDDPDNCASMMDILTDVGFPVDVACDGPAALDLLQQSHYQLALLDYRMPGMNGLELFLRIRQAHPEVVGILITAFASNEVSQAAREAGLGIIMTKPVDFAELLPIIEGTLSKPSRPAH